jgi:hypothetical protein
MLEIHYEIEYPLINLFHINQLKNDQNNQVISANKIILFLISYNQHFQ